MFRYAKLALILVLASSLTWGPVAYTGLPRTSSFSVWWASMIDVGIVSFEPWMDSSGQIHSFRTYGPAGFHFNETSIAEGYQVESYNFTNIPSVGALSWDFLALFAKVENGKPVYEFVDLSQPGGPRPIYPFSGASFEALTQSFNPFTAQWPNRSVVLNAPAYVTNYTRTLSAWTSGTYTFHRQLLGPEVSDVLSLLSPNDTVKVTFTTDWSVNLTMTSQDAQLEEYQVNFRRSASVDLVMRNGTALSATGRFVVRTGETPKVSITYRSIPLPLTIQITCGLLASSAVTVLAVFWRQLGSNIKLLLAKFSRRKEHGPA